MVIESCSLIHLGEISVLTPTTVRILKPMQQYGRLEAVTMDTQQLYQHCRMIILHYLLLVLQ